jgi:hypothetical protein
MQLGWFEQFLIGHPLFNDLCQLWLKRFEIRIEAYSQNRPIGRRPFKQLIWVFHSFLQFRISAYFCPVVQNDFKSISLPCANRRKPAIAVKTGRIPFYAFSNLCVRVQNRFSYSLDACVIGCSIAAIREETAALSLNSFAFVERSDVIAFFGAFFAMLSNSVSRHNG